MQREVPLPRSLSVRFSFPFSPFSQATRKFTTKHATELYFALGLTGYKQTDNVQ